MVISVGWLSPVHYCSHNISYDWVGARSGLDIISFNVWRCQYDLWSPSTQGQTPVPTNQFSVSYVGAWAVLTDLSGMDCDLLRYNRTGQTPSDGLRIYSPYWPCWGWTVRNGDHSHVVTITRWPTAVFLSTMPGSHLQNVGKL